MRDALSPRWPERVAGWPRAVLGPLVHDPVRAVLRGLVGPMLGAVERRLPDVAPPFAPVFLIGSPRTGSTLLYQNLVSYWRVCCIDNLMALFPGAIRAAAWLSRAMFGDRPSRGFTSRHGRTPGLHGPSECGAFWYRWFPREPVYAPAGTLSPQALAGLRAGVAGIMHAWGRPVVFKNLYCSLRLPTLREAFPEALFVFCRREPLHVARSLLECRQRSFGSMRPWFSLKPVEYEAIKGHHYCEQVVEQVYYIERRVAEDLRLFPPGQVRTVWYEQLCERPRETLDGLHAWLAAAGLPVAVRGGAPAPFKASNRSSLGPEDERRLRDAVDRWFGDDAGRDRAVA